MRAPAPTPVIIVGGGPVGLAAALELARFQVPTVLIEQHTTTSRHPKTRNMNTRTMEVARGWGPVVYDRLRGTDMPEGWKSPIRFLRSIVGEELGRIEAGGFVGPGPDVSPALPVMSSQDLLDRILYDAALASGLVDLRFGHTWLGFEEGDGSAGSDLVVQAQDDESGERYELRGAALVAADGPDSPVRESLGIELEGPREIAHFINCYFHADLESHIQDRHGVLFFCSNDEASGVFQPLDARGRWLCQIFVRKDEWNLDTFTPERCRAWIRSAAGLPGIDADVQSVERWRMNATVATTLVRGNVVLCGDAAHQFPPTGGLGVNTGIQAMHNAIWKLAFRVRGWSGPGLLNTYDAERRPVARWITDQSLHNSIQVGRMARAATGDTSSSLPPDEIVAAARRYGNHLGVEFGARYDSAAVVPDGTSPTQVADPYTDYVPSARPGGRAPHLWLGRNDARLSILDLVGPGFTLLTGSAGEGWQRTAQQATAATRVPIATYRIGAAGLEDRADVFQQRYGIDPDGAVLIRPDGYVAWRAKSGAGSQDGLLRAVQQILA